MKKVRYILAAIVLLLMPVAAKAQFTIVDAESKETLPGVYVFSENGSLLTMSNENGEVKALTGKVTLSMLCYEPLTVDASGLHGKVELKQKLYELPEVVVGRTEYVKLSAAFRDVVTNFQKVVLYREGIADYYYNIKSKKWDRRIRACRQYEHASLRKPWEDSVACMDLRLLNFKNVKDLKTSGNITPHGDTLSVGAMKGKTEVKDGVMAVKMQDSYRVIIDQMKFADKTSFSFLGEHYALHKKYVDWTYKKSEYEEASISALRIYSEAEFQWSKKMPVIPIVTQSDLTVYDVTYPSKQEVKEEMNDKVIATDFILPDCLPAMPSAIVEQGKKLVPKKFHDF